MDGGGGMRNGRNHLYRERARIQCLRWAEGKPYHEPINDECCPDFSCCCPDLFTKNDLERWSLYRKEYSRQQ